MLDEDTGMPFTQHTLNDVPAVLVNGAADILALANGRLCDIAPTLLDLMGLDQPDEMTGKSLLLKNKEFSDQKPIAAQ